MDLWLHHNAAGAAMLRVGHIMLVLMAVVSSSAGAEVARQIGWEDLVPKAAPLHHPLKGLSRPQREALEELAWIREQQNQRPPEEAMEDERDAAELMGKLKAQGVDAKALLRRYDDFVNEIVRRGETVVGELDGQLVRLAGYALPLENSQSGVKEFLLVPYVGACIHVPPPPPNQIVLVSLGKAFELKDYFTPVWVTGRMTVGRLTKSLELVDGASSIAMGYSMAGVSVEPYKN
jgi:hypothetical protein